jgi:hypothetical protein
VLYDFLPITHTPRLKGENENYEKANQKTNEHREH